MATNHQTIKFTIIVDVDRSSEAYATQAVIALDPSRKGPGKSADLTTAAQVDATISKNIAFEATKLLLNGALETQYGNSTVRVIHPRNLADILRREEAAEDDSGD